MHLLGARDDSRHSRGLLCAGGRHLRMSMLERGAVMTLHLICGLPPGRASQSLHTGACTVPDVKTAHGSGVWGQDE